MGKRCLLGLILLFLLATPVQAEEQLSEDLRALAPAASELVTDDSSESYGLLSGARTLFSQAIEETQSSLTAGLGSVAAARVVLLGVVESVSPEGDGAVSRCVAAVGALWCTAVSAGDLDSLIGLGRQTVTDLTQLSTALVPALATATAAMGGVSSAAAAQVGAVFFSNLLLTAMDSLLLPMVYLYIGVSAAGAVLEGDTLDSLGRLLKKIIGWLLGGLLLLYTAYLTITGAVAGSADAQTVRLAKAAVRGAVPVVGGILAEASESVVAGAGLLRAMIGSFGALAVLSMCLTPALRLGLEYLLYQGAGLVAATVGPGKLTKLLSQLSDAFALVLAMTVASAMVILISVVSALTAVTA
jgi:stage III sporulation protein AE